ncbi:MAG: hypothetical protein ACK5HY_07905 [Parahaliea sp.]
MRTDRERASRFGDPLNFAMILGGVALIAHALGPLVAGGALFLIWGWTSYSHRESERIVLKAAGIIQAAETIDGDDSGCVRAQPVASEVAELRQQVRQLDARLQEVERSLHS